jgi:CheY-like chemotaxis protein
LSETLAKLLDLSKLEAGVVTPEVAHFDVADLFDKVASAHAPEAKLKGLSLRCASPRLTARTDPVLFERVLGNLVSNAVRYTDRGSVLIGCRRRGGKTWVEVWDTGMGIPGDKTAEIFEEFKQLGNEERNREKGSGLGLAIVAKTADLLGLEIRVQSRLGKGSLFAVELPLGQKEIRVMTREESRYRPLRVAVVDDDIGVLESLVFVLEEAGHQVVAAATSAELLARLENLPPDVMVSDYRLAKGKNGFDAITAVRTAFGRPVPAVILTGDTDPELIRGMASKGVLVHHKPLTFSALQACIAELTYRP